MPRLLDDIRAAGAFEMPRLVRPEKVDEWDKYAKFVFGMLEEPSLPVLLIDNVADYYFRGTDQEHWSLDRDFPNVAPPFPSFWCEHKIPSMIHSREKGDSDMTKWVQRGRVGLLFVAVDPTDAKTADNIEPMPANTNGKFWIPSTVRGTKKGATPAREIVVKI